MRLIPLALAAAIATSLPLLALARTASPPALEKSHIVAVRSRADVDASVVELLGDRPLSFTTLRLEAPPRVVLDFTDASFEGVQGELSVEDGTVRRVGAAAAGVRTARVIIELAGDAEFDVRALGNRLDVRVPRLAPLRLLASRGPEERSPAPAAVAPLPAPVPSSLPSSNEAPPPPVAPPAKDEPSLAAAAQAEPPAAPPAAARPEEPAPPAVVAAAPVAAPPPEEPPVLAASTKVDAETRAPPPAPAVAMLTPSPAPRAAPSEAARESDPESAMAAAEAERDPRIEAAAEASEEAAPAPSPAAQQVAEAKVPASHEPEPPARPQEPPRAKPEPVADARPASPLPAAPEPVAKPQEQARSAQRVEPEKLPEPERAAEPRPKLPTVALVGPGHLALSRARPPAIAAPPPPPPSRAPRPRAVASAHPRKASIHGIGFRPAAGGVVIVRSDHALEYTVTVSDHALVLRLPGASIPSANNRRPLDTSVFGGAVERLVPRIVPGAVELRVELRERVDFEVKQAGAVLTVTFAQAG